MHTKNTYVCTCVSVRVSLFVCQDELKSKRKLQKGDNQVFKR